MVSNKNDLIINTINLIGRGGENNNLKNPFFHIFQILCFESPGSLAIEIFSNKRGAAAAAWYADNPVLPAEFLIPGGI